VATSNRPFYGKQSRGFSQHPMIVKDSKTQNSMYKHIINPIGNFVFFENTPSMSCLPLGEWDGLPFGGWFAGIEKNVLNHSLSLFP
jgi:hypothetical protein